MWTTILLIFGMLAITYIAGAIAYFGLCVLDTQLKPRTSRHTKRWQNIYLTLLPLGWVAIWATLIALSLSPVTLFLIGVPIAWVLTGIIPGIMAITLPKNYHSII